jgi:murein L,D-transpeptidase YafK
VPRVGTTAQRLSGAFCVLAFIMAPSAAPARPVEPRIDGILIEKSARTLTLLHAGKAVAVYKVALGSEPVGPKEREGDGRTPEGDYLIDSRNSRSHYHLSLHISYPNPADRERARQRGVSPGGDIMIHGLPNGLGWIGPAHRLRDWTQGCIAVTNAEIEEIWKLVPLGTPVKIQP